MTPRKLEAKTKRERVQTRKQLGSLKSLTVQPATKARYEKARAGFYRFLKKEGLAIPASREKLDDLLADYLEHLWSSGQGKGVASDTVAGLQDLDPKLRGSLQVCWRLLRHGPATRSLTGHHLSRRSSYMHLRGELSF